MSEPYTRRDAEAAFERLCKLLGKRQATAWNDVGGWSLDYAGVYGGFVVEEVGNASGGVSRPLGDRRRPAREFCEAVWFAERVLGESPAFPLVEAFHREARSWHESTGHADDAVIHCDGICEVMVDAEAAFPQLARDHGNAS